MVMKLLLSDVDVKTHDTYILLLFRRLNQKDSGLEKDKITLTKKRINDTQGMRGQKHAAVVLDHVR